MANNLTEVIPKLLAQGLLALREYCVMPRLVNSDYSTQAAEKGSSIDVPIPSAIAVNDVVPGPTPPAGSDSSPTSANIALNQWKEANFHMTDKDEMEAISGVIPMQASEAIKAIANTVNGYILSKYTKIYGQYGTAGTTPFASDTTAATGVRKVLTKQLAFKQDRSCVVDPDAEANALNLRAFQDVSWAGDAGVIRDGELNTKLGFFWYTDQDIPTHTAGTLSNGTNPVANINGALSVNAVTMDIDETTLTGTVEPGDVFTIAGVDANFVVTNSSTLTASGNAIAGITFSPALPVAVADNTVITLIQTHVVNLAFHRDCFAFASRPLADNSQGLGNIISSAVDPVSGLTLRLEVSREHKRTKYSYDILYGAECVRPALGARLLG